MTYPTAVRLELQCSSHQLEAVLNNVAKYLTEQQGLQSSRLQQDCFWDEHYETDFTTDEECLIAAEWIYRLQYELLFETLESANVAAKALSEEFSTQTYVSELKSRRMIA